MTQGDGFDRLRGTGAPTQKPLDRAKRPEEKKSEVIWRPVPGREWIEQSNETPPRYRTKDDPLTKGYR